MKKLQKGKSIAKYQLFAGTFQPRGGWKDFKGNFQTKTDCYRELGKNTKLRWFQIVENFQIVDEGKVQC